MTFISRKEDEELMNIILHPNTPLITEQEALLDALLIRTIEDIIRKTPNDQDLGKTMREIFSSYL